MSCGNTLGLQNVTIFTEMMAKKGKENNSPLQRVSWPQNLTYILLFLVPLQKIKMICKFVVGSISVLLLVELSGTIMGK